MAAKASTRLPAIRGAAKAYDAAVASAFRAAFQTGAERVEAWEKGNHRWQNRTGRAEKGLRCFVQDDGGRLRLVNVQTDPDRWFLETVQAGRFAILQEALRRQWVSIMADCARRARGAR